VKNFDDRRIRLDTIRQRVGQSDRRTYGRQKCRINSAESYWRAMKKEHYLMVSLQRWVLVL